MKLIYRGQPYIATNPCVETREVAAEATFLGAHYKLKRHKVVRCMRPPIWLTYRGATYLRLVG